MRVGRWAAGVLAAGACLGGAASARASELVEITIPARGGEVADMWLPRYAGPPRAKVLLPDGYDPAQAYPLLLLLVGLSSNYSDWSDPGQGEIATTAAGFPGIIVMPEGGDGWYADWWNGGRRGDPAWESYILDQVLPQIQARYRIRRERRFHAIAGVSMGGLGTAYLGGRLAVSTAGSPVTITTDGGCVVHTATPARIPVPARPCASLGLTVRPRVLRTGHATRLTATVRPPAPGVVVRVGGARAVTDAQGRARLRVCLRVAARRQVRASADDRLPAAATVRAHGRRRSCTVRN